MLVRRARLPVGYPPEHPARAARHACLGTFGRNRPSPRKGWWEIRGQRQVAFDHAAGNEPQGPTELPKRSWWAVLKRTVWEFGKDNLLDRAAALTYYGVCRFSRR
jgi:hypothetical protein